MRKKQTPQIRTIGFVSLGCPKNLVDSEKMLGLLAEDGLVLTHDLAKADAIVINTCGFLQAAKEESMGVIREAAGMKKTGQCQRVIVAGCLAQRYRTKLLEEAARPRVPDGCRIRPAATQCRNVQFIIDALKTSDDDDRPFGQRVANALRRDVANVQLCRASNR